MSFLVAFILFLLAAVAPLFHWHLGDFDPSAWAFVAFSLGVLRDIRR